MMADVIGWLPPRHRTTRPSGPALLNRASPLARGLIGWGPLNQGSVFANLRNYAETGVEAGTALGGSAHSMVAKKDGLAVFGNDLGWLQVSDQTMGISGSQNRTVVFWVQDNTIVIFIKFNT